MQPNISVGIVTQKALSFCLNGKYYHNSTELFTGEYIATIDGETLLLTGNERKWEVKLPFLLIPENYETTSIELHEVVIGKEFHWEQSENQVFKGCLKIIEEEGQITAVNILPLEDYLLSVISSEMSATSSKELLKAHAVISRSWLLAQIEKEQTLKESDAYSTTFISENERVKWYDREDHLNYDVCADDHCQRYQGITKSSTLTVQEAIKSTFGQVLSYNGKICDARYSKCCGGATELFENVWEPISHPYLTALPDHMDSDSFPDLTLEKNAVDWIEDSPPAFCNTKEGAILSQVLNNYDQKTTDFYRWTISYSQQELKQLLLAKIRLDLGDVIKIEALERGASGRIVRLKIVGVEGAFIIGKELEIRKALSSSHLYSSAFVVNCSDIIEGVPQTFTFRGAGWGHGVGLCQIGAAVMSEKGYSYQEILQHYFKEVVIEKKY